MWGRNPHFSSNRCNLFNQENWRLDFWKPGMDQQVKMVTCGRSECVQRQPAAGGCSRWAEVILKDGVHDGGKKRTRKHWQWISRIIYIWCAARWSSCNWHLSATQAIFNGREFPAQPIYPQLVVANSQSDNLLSTLEMEIQIPSIWGKPGQKVRNLMSSRETQHDKWKWKNYLNEWNSTGLRWVDRWESLNITCRSERKNE